MMWSESYHMKQQSLVLILTWILGAGALSGAENPFNVDCFVGWDLHYRPGTWTPLEIGITSTLTENFDGRVHVSVAQDGVNRMNITQGFVLTVGQPAHIPLVTRIGFEADELNLRLTDAQGRLRERLDIGLFDFSSRIRTLKAVNHEDLFVGLVGRLRFGLGRLPENTRCSFHGQHGNTGQVYVTTKLPHMVPWDWTGFDGLDLLVLYDPDWSRFRNEQIKAITEWVRHGGKLLVVLGTFPFPGNSLLARQLPVSIGALQEVGVTTSWLERWGLDATRAEQAVCYELSVRDKTRVYTQPRADEPTLFSAGQLGFGRVGVLGLDPAALDEGQRDNAAGFWVHAFNRLLEDLPGDTEVAQVTGFRPSRNTRRRYARRSGHLQAVVGPSIPDRRSIRLTHSRGESMDQNPNVFRYDMGTAQRGTSKVLDYLAGIQEMRPLSIGWVVLLLVLLAVLLGPVDYMVLKRLDRQPLTWVTSIFWIILFTVGAYYGVQALRAGDMQLRTVSVVDAVQGQGSGWTTQVCGLFAPRSADYALDQLEAGQWWSAVAPSEGQVSAYHARSSSRNLYCAQGDGGNLPYSLPINIWTMQTLLMEAQQASQVLQARLQVLDGAAKLEIRNQADCPIEQGILLFNNDRGLRIGRIEPGQTITVDGALKPIRNWDTLRSGPSGGWTRSLSPVDAFDLIGAQGRSQGIRDYLSQGAAAICVQFDEAPTPVTVKRGPCKYHHVQFARLVVFPE